MNRIDAKFIELKKLRRKALIVYITAGDPALHVTEKLVLALEASGVDMVELGIPFSDPLADGPTIQAASQRALRNKINLARIFRSVRSLRRKTDIPIAFMTYYNPVLKYGLERFIRDCGSSGVDGVIVPDLPLEESKGLAGAAKRSGVALINLIAPTSTPKRITRIVKSSRGFIYYVSLTGVTGARDSLPSALASKLRLIKSMTAKPVCVGFGISRPAQAKAASRAADGVIVGSAVVRIIQDNAGNRGRLISKVSGFVRSLAKVVHDA